MYTISRFSQLCKMSTRMLRHYDKEQLLNPIHVDASNGYRYYEKSQLETALRIKKLREYTFSLPEIRTILQTTDEESLNQLMNSKIQELSSGMSQYKEIILEMQGIIEQKTVVIHGESSSYDVLFGMRNEITVISRRLQSNIAEMDKYVDSLFEIASKNHFRLLGAPSAIFWDEEFTPDNCDIELMIPIIQRQDQHDLKKYEIKQLPSKLVASTLHIGGYDYIGYAHMALEEWIAVNGYSLDGPPYETYLKSLECDCTPEEYVTQVCFPIIKKSK
ncbi:MerR family transcriptional regulator [Paenibacillus sp. GSMTC-2017]|uniref:MerR family transcriptional regulator n=1 Tax=Paenibacillus sp. GSMTC-2017 TaxID=2794350 RepID=UPI0018DA34F3|nr:MerR family transcriptional regulator [Paenibacillus sp. GSMTC-2017]MBH5319421.1 MerR family transcriptional regulator [Paenibacillus sp. GSMTC-2017]